MVGKTYISYICKVISNRDINLSACRLLLSVIRPSVEMRSGKGITVMLFGSTLLDGAKWILGCSSKTYNEAIRDDMSLYTLHSGMDRTKLKWSYKLCRYIARAVFSAEIFYRAEQVDIP